jgi:hypothetical protein
LSLHSTSSKKRTRDRVERKKKAIGIGPENAGSSETQKITSGVACPPTLSTKTLAFLHSIVGKFDALKELNF